MRLLHVSDWHLGRATYGESRAPDHEAVLDEILDIARAARPDLVVHTGDLFDAARPSYLDMARAIDVLSSLGGVAPVVVLAGNHDSPALFALFGRLLGPDARIRFVDKARPPAHGGVLTYPGPDGERIRLASVPFVHANRMVDAFEDPATWMATYAERLRRVESALARGLFEGFDPDRDVTVFAAHLHLGGARFSGSERAIHVTDTYAARPEHLPQVSYAALGHIHRPQALPGTVGGRYAGSPLQLDFGEVGEVKHVVLVEALPGRPARIEPVELHAGRPLVRLEGTLDHLRALAPSVGRALCLVTVHTDAPMTALSEQVRDLLPEAVLVAVHEQCAARRVEVLRRTGVAKAEPGFGELLRDYLAEVGTRGAEVDRVLSAFAALVRGVEEEELPVFPEEALLPPLGADDAPLSPLGADDARPTQRGPESAPQPPGGREGPLKDGQDRLFPSGPERGGGG